MPPSNKKKTGKAKLVKPVPTSLSIDKPPISPTPSSNSGSSSTAPAPSISPSTDPSSTTIDFREFLDRATTSDIMTFVIAASKTPGGANLEPFWLRAFNDGRKAGFEDGKLAGYEYEDEYSATKAPPPTTSVSPPPIITRSTNASTQTYSVSEDEFQSDPEYLNALCTRAAAAAYSTPFGAIWDRAFKAGFKSGHDDGTRLVEGMAVTDVLKIGFEKGQVYGIIQEREQWQIAGHSEACFVTTNSPSCDVEIQATPADLDWDSDPRLSDLSRALQALGWSRSH